MWSAGNAINVNCISSFIDNVLRHLSRLLTWTIDGLLLIEIWCNLNIIIELFWFSLLIFFVICHVLSDFISLHFLHESIIMFLVIWILFHLGILSLQPILSFGLSSLVLLRLQSTCLLLRRSSNRSIQIFTLRCSTQIWAVNFQGLIYSVIGMPLILRARRIRGLRWYLRGIRLCFRYSRLLHYEKYARIYIILLIII